MKSFHENYIRTVQCLAEEMRKLSLPKVTEELFALYETTGNRLNYEEVYFLRRKFLAVFAMASYIGKKEEDIRKLSEIVQEICEEECWALPAHVNRKEDKNWRNTVDLFASETAQTLAEIIGFINPSLPKELQLSKTLCDRVGKEIEERVFTPFFTSEPNYGCFECADHNWNAVCMGSIGSACIYLMQEKEKERLSACLQRVCHSLTFYLDGFREDGACMEGIGYFTYGMTYFVGFAEQLLRYSKGTINLFDNEKVQKIAQFQQKMYFASGKTVSFSDGEQKARFKMGLTSFLAKQYEGVRIPKKTLAAEFTSDTCYRFMGLLRDYLWTMEDGEESKTEDNAPTARHEILPDAQWSICESEAETALAIKGGTNGEPHNHNDVGSFCFVAGDEFLLTDLGAGEYTKEYFGAGRYDILCNSSLGHSVPMIGGCLQEAGTEHKASEFFADGAGTTVISFAGAYPRKVAKKLTRTTRFSLTAGDVMVEDAYALPKGTNSFTEQLVTQYSVELTGFEIKIRGKAYDAIVTLPKEVHDIRCVEKVHKNHEGKAETVRLVQWDIPLKQDTENEGCTSFSVRAYKK